MAKLKLLFFLSIFVATATGTKAFAFDLEDYATTYRATRDAYLKADNERKLAQGPWDSAAKTWIDLEITEQTSKGNNEAVQLLLKMRKKISSCSL
jgi:hypothetical protein